MSSCCPTDRPAIAAEYSPLGVKLSNGDYVVRAEDAEFGIIYITDIFGLAPQALQVADVLAKNTKSTVYVPDFFHGNPWPHLSNFEGLSDWLGQNTNWDTQIRPLIVKGIHYLKEKGITKIGGIGFCWGTKMLVRAAQENLVDCVVGPHPSFLNDGDEIKEGLNYPVCLLLSKDEGPHTAWYKAIEKADESIKNISIITKFPTMHHGWMAARADFSDPENKKEADRGMEIVSDFFNKFFARP